MDFFDGSGMWSVGDSVGGAIARFTKSVVSNIISVIARNIVKVNDA